MRRSRVLNGNKRGLTSVSQPPAWAAAAASCRMGTLRWHEVNYERHPWGLSDPEFHLLEHPGGNVGGAVCRQHRHHTLRQDGAGVVALIHEVDGRAAEAGAAGNHCFVHPVGSQGYLPDQSGGITVESSPSPRPRNGTYGATGSGRRCPVHPAKTRGFAACERPI